MTMLAPRDAQPSSPSRDAVARRFRELYLRELDFVWTVLLRLGVADDHVEDAAHDVFVVVHRQLHRFEGRSSPRTWLYAIARRIAWRHRRTERRRARRHAALATEHPVPTELDDVLRGREARELLAAFLETLDWPKREAFVLGELEALPRTSLGRALGVSPGTAYSRLRAARADFAAAFGPDGPRGAIVSRRARAREPVPQDARQRVWLALPGGLGSAVAGTGTSGAVAFASTLVGGLGLLGVLALVLPSPAVPRAGGDGTAVSTLATDGHEPRAGIPEPPPEPASLVAATGNAGPPTAAGSITTRGGSEPEPSRAARRERPTASEVAPERRPPSEVSSVPRADSPSAAAPPDPLAEEAELMAEARAAMRAEEWDRARDRLERHAERFPSGTLGVERRASAIVVACRQGREEDALAEARVLASGPVPAAIEASLRSSCVGERFDDDRSIRSSATGDQGE